MVSEYLDLFHKLNDLKSVKVIIFIIAAIMFKDGGVLIIDALTEQDLIFESIIYHFSNFAFLLVIGIGAYYYCRHLYKKDKKES